MVPVGGVLDHETSRTIRYELGYLIGQGIVPYVACKQRDVLLPAWVCAVELRTRFLDFHINYSHSHPEWTERRGTGVLLRKLRDVEPGQPGDGLVLRPASSSKEEAHRRARKISFVEQRFEWD